MRIYVGNLDSDVSEPMLQELFTPFGEVSKVTLMRDRRGISKGVAFVEMPAESSAASAINSLNRTLFHDRTLDICRENTRPGGKKKYFKR